MKDKTVSRRQFAIAGAVGVVGVGVSILGCATQKSTGKSAEASAGASTTQSDAATQAAEVVTLTPAELAQQKAQEQTEKLIADLSSLVSPFKVDSKVVDTTLINITIDAHKRGVLTLKDNKGAEHIVDICRRTNKAKLRGPVARTNDYVLYLRNGAKGSRPTNESVGLAIMALGDVIQTNEKNSIPLNLISKEEQWSTEKSKAKR